MSFRRPCGGNGRTPAIIQYHDGKSAYQVAVDNGFTGTVDEWLKSLVGPAGESAYQVWLDAGNTGTVQDFFAAIVGPKGDSAYDTWIKLGNTGTESDFIASLKGDSASGEGVYIKSITATVTDPGDS